MRNEEEPVIGSRLKMKIKFSNPAAISSLAAATSAAGDDENQLVYRDPEHDRRSNNSGEPIPAPTLTSSPTNQSPSPTEKREKKQKQMNDGLLSHSGKRKRSSVTKSDHVGSSHGLKVARKRSSVSNGALTNNEEKTPARIRAEEFQSTLSSEFPSFTKLMVRSHVVNGFWMGIPGHFSREHLPRTDTAVILVDESEKEYELKYNGEKMGLSAGWRKFSVEQKLIEDDVLIFQLVEPCKFKVYVVRANDFNDVDGALSLLNLEALIERNDAEKDRGEGRSKATRVSTYKRKRTKFYQSGSLLVKNKKTRPGKSVPRPLQLTKKLEIGYKTTSPGSSSSPNFESIKNFEDFTITVDGLCIDSELPEDIRSKYYDLCSWKSCFLHARLAKGLNSKLVAGVICETVKISDAIRTCSLMTSEDEFEKWDMTLKSFELLGMNVRFIREKVDRLVGLAFVSDDAQETRKYVEAKMNTVQAEDEIINLETKIIELKEASVKYNAEVEALKFKAEKYELEFQKEVDAPW